MLCFDQSFSLQWKNVQFPRVQIYAIKFFVVSESKTFSMVINDQMIRNFLLMGLIVLSLAASHNHVLKQFGNLERVSIKIYILLIYNISDSMWAK